MDNDFYSEDLTPSLRLTWQEVWSTAVMNPSLESFELILGDPAARPQRAYTWIFFTATFSAIVNMIFIFSNSRTFLPPGYSYGGSIVPTMICTAALTGPFAILGLIIAAGILQFIARLLGGVGTFREFVYVYGAILAPMALVSAAFNVLPMSLIGITQLLGLILGIYQLVLVGKALKAVNHYSTRAATVTVLIPTIVIIFLFSCSLSWGLYSVAI